VSTHDDSLFEWVKVADGSTVVHILKDLLLRDDLEGTRLGHVLVTHAVVDLLRLG